MLNKNETTLRNLGIRVNNQLKQLDRSIKEKHNLIEKLQAEKDYHKYCSDLDIKTMNKINIAYYIAMSVMTGGYILNSVLTFGPAMLIFDIIPLTAVVIGTIFLNKFKNSAIDRVKKRTNNEIQSLNLQIEKEKQLISKKQNSIAVLREYNRKIQQNIIDLKSGSKTNSISTINLNTHSKPDKNPTLVKKY
ncbi:MAG: hypothetical protein PHS45_03025 [Bacilli bacterium]|nr:hypothetical protein [Bacilli bacterium]